MVDETRIWDRQASKAVQTRWDDGLTTWDDGLPEPSPTLWDLDIETTDIWTRQ